MQNHQIREHYTGTSYSVEFVVDALEPRSLGSFATLDAALAAYPDVEWTEIDEFDYETEEVSRDIVRIGK